MRSSAKRRSSPLTSTESKPKDEVTNIPPKIVKPKILTDNLDLVNDVTDKHTTNKSEQRRPRSGVHKKRTKTAKISRPSTQEKRSLELRNTSVSRTSIMQDDFLHSKPPRAIFFSRKTPLVDIKRKTDKERLDRVDEYSGSKQKGPDPKGKGVKANYAAYRQSLVKHGKDHTPKNVPDGVDRATNSRKSMQPIPLYMRPNPIKPRRDVDPLYSSHNNFDRLALQNDFENRPKTSPEILERRPGSISGDSTRSEKINLKNSDNQLIDLMNVLNTSKPSPKHGIKYTVSPPQTMASNFEASINYSVPSKMINHDMHRKSIAPLSSSFASLKHRRASLSKPATPGTSTFGSTTSTTETELLKEIIKSQRAAAQRPSSRKSTPDQKKRRPVSGLGHIPASPARLPPVTPSRKKRLSRRPRCAQCNRRIQISTTHHCRCGRSFCAQHRYAETHGCTYDYKAEGRKLLHISNPLVQPQKLPKI